MARQTRKQLLANLKKARAAKIGGGFLGDAWNTVKSGASKVHSFVKDNRILSKGAGLAGYSKAAQIIHAMGYGKPHK